jgi:4-phosphopantoate--beta-alanine ligase
MNQQDSSSIRSPFAAGLQADEIPASHPRADSLRIRNLLVAGVEAGITSPHGLIAHGRGEAFDYLLGERTQPFAQVAIAETARRLRAARWPVLSVNGNAAALAATSFAQLAALLSCPIEVNIFHPSEERQQRIKQHLLANGAQHVLLPEEGCELPGLASHRRKLNSQGIFKADLVFVPLEDGDRAQALVQAGKQVICVDLNPLSRSAQVAQVTIVDNLVRALPLLVAKIAEHLRVGDREEPTTHSHYDNQALLRQAESYLRRGSAPSADPATRQH